MNKARYIAIDLKSFYASVECVERGLDPLSTNLVVADPSRTDKTIPAVLLGRVNLLPSVRLFIQYGIFHLKYPFRFSSSDCGIGGRTLLSLK